MKKNLISIITTVVISAIISAISTFIVLKFNTPDKDILIEDYYATENAIHVSPHWIRKQIDEGIENFILVDLRSQEEYEEEHIIWAVNIPAYKDPDTSAYDDKERIVGEFQMLIDKNPDKDIIVYCYSTACMTGRKMWYLLAKNDIYVKHLGIGWNERRYNWNWWNHPHERNTTNVQNYIWTGKEPWVNPNIIKKSNACPIGNNLGC